MVLYELRIIGNSFLYRMVRNIVGCIFEVLKNNYSVDDIELMFKIKNKKYINYTTAPAKGLSLYNVNY